MSARDGGISDRIDNTPQQTGMAGRQGGRAGRQGGQAGRKGGQGEQAGREGGRASRKGGQGGKAGRKNCFFLDDPFTSWLLLKVLAHWWRGPYLC